jgi:DNA polymerase
MDAREQLRRYLEQRREMGESELVLDGMSVEEVLRVVGAARAKGATARVPDVETPRAPQVERSTQPPADTADWREMLRAAGAVEQPPSPTLRAAPPAPVDMAPPAGELAPPAERAAEPPADAAPVPAPATSLAAAFGAPAGIVVGQPMHELFGGPMAGLATLEQIAEAVAGCTRCPLYATATNPVPGEGNPNADFVCVGEAPGETEDRTGRPFVGQAGQLLTKILAAIDLRRQDVFICNVLKHRPPGNRNPAPDEVAACSPYLVRQLELIRPKVILALGTFAAQTLLDTKLSIGKLRGSVHRYYGIPLVVTYHPAALLRNPAWKRPTWEDVQLARRILDRSGSA